jgi:hypothetical protein
MVQGGDLNPEPLSLFQEKMSVSAKLLLNDGQWEKYRSEIERRDEDRKQTAIRCLVDILDRDLLLSDEQRGKIRESLDAEWKDAKGLSLQIFRYSNQFTPSFPAKCVAPFLEPAQREVWQSSQLNRRIHFGLSYDGLANDGLFRHEELDQAANKPAAAP